MADLTPWNPHLFLVQSQISRWFSERGAHVAGFLDQIHQSFGSMLGGAGVPGNTPLKLRVRCLAEMEMWGGSIETKISFGGIPNSRNVLFLQIFLKRAAKPSAGNTSAGFPWIKWPQILLNLTWLCTKASQTFSGTFSGTQLNLCTKASQTFSGTFSGTLLNVTWLCTKATQTFSRNLRNLLRNLVEPDPATAPVHTGAILGWRPH